ncbi:MAG: hypothetical protein ACPGVG_18875, partial [Mycobacterium sp.]
MERGELSIRETIGDFVLRDHDTDHELEAPFGLVGSKMLDRGYDIGIRTEWVGDMSSWMWAGLNTEPQEGEAGEGVIPTAAPALYHSSATHSAYEEQPREVGIWAAALPAVYTAEGLYMMFDGNTADPRLQPWIDQTDYPADALEGEGEYQFVTSDRRLPRGGEEGILVPGTDEKVQRSILFAQREQVAQHLGPGGIRYTTPIYDLIEREDGEPGRIGEIDRGRAGGLHQLVRVVNLTSIDHADEKPYDYQAAIWGGTHKEDFAGGLLVSGQTIGDRYAKRGCDQRETGEGGTENSAGEGSNTNPNDGDSLTDNVNSYMNATHGGPIHLRMLDRGYINVDGEPVTSAGIWTRAIFHMRPDRDGPMNFEEPPYPDDVNEADHKVRVHRQYECSTELWKEWSTTMVGTPKPPTIIPPNVPGDPGINIEDRGRRLETEPGGGGGGVPSGGGSGTPGGPGSRTTDPTLIRDNYGDGSEIDLGRWTPIDY